MSSRMISSRVARTAPDIVSVCCFPDELRRPTLKVAEQRQSNKPKASLGSEHVFGLHPVLLALRARKRVLYELHVDEGKLSKIDRLEESPLLLQILDLAKEQELPVSGCPQPACISGAVEQTTSDVGENPGRPLWLFMDRIQDPMNFGAVLRSSCYFGVQKVFVPGKDSCRLSPTVSKASSGALELMDLYVLNAPEQFMTELKARGWWIMGTSSFYDSKRHASHSESVKLTWDLPPPDKPLLLIVGCDTESPYYRQSHRSFAGHNLDEFQVMFCTQAGDPGFPSW
ncbi:hypothetical protein HPB52_022525 [Rhipicephalus sanguineus]|uniref:tRNA/rRNA methyltransferase SpoU type domain-containing protein n=1 Tax=Rhipicephalus sanguineus TaxID=34632 RepID=A0A9D4SZ97_RHISA|nr:hypothetical protein HPB52_022525 [Rhipicephalus sanguineus]